MKNEICVLRSPSPFILSPPSSPRFDAITPKPEAKADRRGNSRWPILVLRMIVRQIQSHEFPSRWRTILLLLGEKAGLREGVKLIGWCCNSTVFADNKVMVDRDKIQFNLIKLLNGERILRLTEPQSGLALE